MYERLLDLAMRNRTTRTVARVLAISAVTLGVAGCDSGNSGQKQAPTVASDGTIVQETTPAIASSTVRPAETKTVIPSLVPSVAPRPSEPSLTPTTISPTRTNPTESLPTTALSKGKALRLGGFNDYVQYSGEKLQIDGLFTVEARVKLESGVPGGDAVAVKGDAREAWGFYVKLARCIGLDGIRMGAVIDGRSVCSSLVVPKGQYADVAMSFDQKVVRFYLNGVTVEVPLVANVPVENGDFRVGLSPKGLMNESFHGEIDGVAVWKGVREPKQIAFDLQGMKSDGFDAKQATRIGLIFWAPFSGDFSDIAQGISGTPKGDASLVSIN